MFTVSFVLYERAGVPLQEALRYWREKHGPLVKSVTEFSRHVRRYVQCHLVKTEVPWGTGADYDGVAELWFDSAESAAEAFGEPKYMEIIRPDELEFADLENSISFMTEEKPVI